MVTANRPTKRSARPRCHLTLQTPDGKTSEELIVVRDPSSGSLFAIDASFLDSCDNTVQSPYNPGHSVYVRPDELKIPKQKRTTVTVPRLL